ILGTTYGPNDQTVATPVLTWKDSGAVSVAGALSVGGAVTASSGLTVTGNLTAKSTLSVDETMSVGGQVAGTLTVQHQGGNTMLPGEGGGAPGPPPPPPTGLSGQPATSTLNRLHISGGEKLYLLNKEGVIVAKNWGGNGNLTVEGNLTVQGALTT